MCVFRSINHVLFLNSLLVFLLCIQSSIKPMTIIFRIPRIVFVHEKFNIIFKRCFGNRWKLNLYSFDSLSLEEKYPFPNNSANYLILPKELLLKGTLKMNYFLVKKLILFFQYKDDCAISSEIILQ